MSENTYPDSNWKKPTFEEALSLHEQILARYLADGEKEFCDMWLALDEYIPRAQFLFEKLSGFHFLLFAIPNSFIQLQKTNGAGRKGSFVSLRHTKLILLMSKDLFDTDVIPNLMTEEGAEQFFYKHFNKLVELYGMFDDGAIDVEYIPAKSDLAINETLDMIYEIFGGDIQGMDETEIYLLLQAAEAEDDEGEDSDDEDWMDDMITFNRKPTKIQQLWSDRNIREKATKQHAKAMRKLFPNAYASQLPMFWEQEMKFYLSGRN